MQISNFLRKNIKALNFHFYNFFSDKNLIKVNEAQRNIRLDNFIKQKFHLKYSLIQKLLRTKQIYIKEGTNNKIIYSPEYRLQLADEFFYPKDLKIPEIKQKTPENEIKMDQKLKEIIKNMIFFEDKNYLVLNKIANISTQGGQENHRNIYTLLKKYYNDEINVSIIHRLDKNTTGLLVLAKNQIAARTMSFFFMQQENIEKYYLALVDGIPNVYSKQGISKGMINLPLIFNKKMKICNSFNEEKIDCETFFQIMGVFELDEEKSKLFYYERNQKIIEKPRNSYISLLKIRIKGGKKHQIRAHLSQVLKTPILFDRKYGFENTRLEKKLLDFLSIGNKHSNILSKNEIKFNENSTIVNQNEENHEKFEFSTKEYHALHAFQIFLHIERNIQNFHELIYCKTDENLEKNGEIMIKAGLPVFFKELFEKSELSGENLKFFVENLEKTRF